MRGFELAEMAAKAKRVLSSTTSVQMAYPALLLVYMYGYCMLFGGVIFPQVLDVRPLDQWPDLGRLLYHVDTFCYEYWWLTLTAIIGLVLAYFSSLKRWAGPLRDRFDRMPLLWRNRRDLRAALLIVSLAGLFDSNLTLRAALDRLLKTADPWLRWHLKIMDRRLTARSDEPMRALDTGIFSVTIVDTITDAAGRDQFEAAIKSLGRESLDRVVEAVKRNARMTHLHPARLCRCAVPDARHWLVRRDGCRQPHIGESRRSQAIKEKQNDQRKQRKQSQIDPIKERRARILKIARAKKQSGELSMIEAGAVMAGAALLALAVYAGGKYVLDLIHSSQFKSEAQMFHTGDLERDAERRRLLGGDADRPCAEPRLRFGGLARRIGQVVGQGHVQWHGDGCRRHARHVERLVGADVSGHLDGLLAERRGADHRLHAGDGQRHDDLFADDDVQPGDGRRRRARPMAQWRRWRCGPRAPKRGPPTWEAFSRC